MIITFLNSNLINLIMRSTLIPVKAYVSSSKPYYFFYIWSESWASTDDFYLIWYQNEVKPLYHHRLYYKGEKGEWIPIELDFHYNEKTFSRYLDEFISSLKLDLVIFKTHTAYLIHSFEENYHWVFDPTTDSIHIALSIKPAISPRSIYINYRETVRQMIKELIMKGVQQRLEFAKYHTGHLTIISPKKR